MGQVYGRRFSAALEALACLGPIEKMQENFENEFTLEKFHGERFT